MQANAAETVQGTVQAKTAGATAPAMGHPLSSPVGLKVSSKAHLGGVLKTGTVAVKSSLALKVLVGVGAGLAGLAIAAHSGDVSVAQATVSAVPTWTHGQTILSHIQAGLGGGASGGAGINLGW
jgi:hypothetical protein